MNIGPYDTEVANLALVRNDLDFLFKYCEEEIKRNPENWDPYYMLGTVHSLLFITEKKIEHVEKAIEYFEKALTLVEERRPRNSILSGLGRRYADIGRLDLSKEALRQAEQEPHLQEEVYLDLFEIALKERDRMEAESIFNLLPDDFKRPFHYFGLAGIDKPALRKLIDDTFGK